MPSDRVHVVDYRPEWAAMFQMERERIMAALGDILPGIEHIGSTSVPGLAAKPVIDMMPGFACVEAFDATDGIAIMQGMGYIYVDRYNDIMPFRRYFVLEGDNPEHPRDHLVHVHMVAAGGDFWTSHVAFREYLRAHPDEMKRYGDFKQQIAPQFASTFDYADAKGEFVRGMVEKAVAWYSRQG
ncbi:MAG: GrpB family protein [Chloroflexota bacterium]